MSKPRRLKSFRVRLPDLLTAIIRFETPTGLATEFVCDPMDLRNLAAKLNECADRAEQPVIRPVASAEGSQLAQASNPNGRWDFSITDDRRRALLKLQTPDGSTLELMLPPADIHRFAEQALKTAALLVTPSSETVN